MAIEEEEQQQQQETNSNKKQKIIIMKHFYSLDPTCGKDEVIMHTGYTIHIYFVWVIYIQAEPSEDIPHSRTASRLIFTQPARSLRLFESDLHPHLKVCDLSYRTTSRINLPFFLFPPSPPPPHPTPFFFFFFPPSILFVCFFLLIFSFYFCFLFFVFLLFLLFFFFFFFFFGGGGGCGGGEGSMRFICYLERFLSKGTR